MSTQGKVSRLSSFASIWGFKMSAVRGRHRYKTESVCVWEREREKENERERLKKEKDSKFSSSLQKAQSEQGIQSVNQNPGKEGIKKSLEGKWRKYVEQLWLCLDDKGGSYHQNILL